MRFVFWKRLSSPLLTPKEIQIQEIVSNLNRWTVEDRKEILTAVVNKVFPTMHLHINPRKKVSPPSNPQPFESVHKKQLDMITDKVKISDLPPLVAAEVMAHFDNLVNKGVYGGNK